jgi:hypothetical protein
LKARIPTIVAVTALVVTVLGATSVGHAAAGMVLPRDSVGTPQLQAGAVTGTKIKNGGVTAAKFRPGTVLRGPRGPKGEQGPAGPQGPTGAAASSGYQIVWGPSVPIGPGELKSVLASCPQGKKAIGGGASSNGSPFVFRWLGATADSYLATAKNLSTQPDFLSVWAVCVTVVA